MTRSAATLVGLTAIMMWATLATLTAASGAVPPFLLNALCFTASGLVGLVAVRVRTGSLAVLRQPWPVWLLGVLGLFGYHFLYFTAVKTAPPADASLICYLWPLLIVIFSGFLPGETLKAHHIVGALAGLVGAGLIVTRGGTALSLSPAYAFGYGVAVVAAITWALYSVLSRRFAGVPSATVAGFCLATGVLSALCHLAFETTVWPSGPVEWGAVALLAALPIGLAFFTWDVGMKHGDIQVLGAAAYAAPLLSTLLLIAVGISQASWVLLIACALISGGGLVAAKDMLLRRKP